MECRTESFQLWLSLIEHVSMTALVPLCWRLANTVAGQFFLRLGFVERACASKLEES